MQALARTLARLSEDAVQEGMVHEAIAEPEGPYEEGLAHYTAWWEARSGLSARVGA